MVRGFQFRREVVNERVGPWWKYLVLTDRYGTAAGWRLENHLDSKDVRVVTSADQLRGVDTIADTVEVVKLRTPGVRDRRYEDLIATFEEMQASQRQERGL